MRKKKTHLQHKFDINEQNNSIAVCQIDLCRWTRGRKKDNKTSSLENFLTKSFVGFAWCCCSWRCRCLKLDSIHILKCIFNVWQCDGWIKVTNLILCMCVCVTWRERRAPNIFSALLPPSVCLSFSLSHSLTANNWYANTINTAKFTKSTKCQQENIQIKKKNSNSMCTNMYFIYRKKMHSL